MAKTVVVVDGMGGGIGAKIVALLRKEIKVEISLLAIATNAVAAKNMVDAGADRGASGENAFRISLPHADFVLGPIGIAFPNAMMGEVTPAMAEAVLMARARKLLLPIAQSHVEIVGLPQCNVLDLVGEAVAALERALGE